MRDDRARVEDVRAWLAKARLDLRAGEFELTAPDASLVADVAFHAQQAAEKALKAFLAWHDRPVRKTHSLEALGEPCLALDPDLREVVDRAIPLTEYAWRFRYPGEAEEPAPVEAEEALDTARAVYRAVLSRLPDEVDPDQ